MGEDRQQPRGSEATDDFEALVSGFVESLTEDNEHPRAALVSRDGVERVADGEATVLGRPAVVVVTNARLIFTAPDEEMDLEEWSLYYGDIAGVSIEREAANRVSVTSAEDVVWRCTLPNANPEVLDAVTRHLRWIDRVRTRIRDLDSTVEQAAEEIRRHASEMNWAAGRERYRSVREALDEVTSMVQLTTPLADAVFAPELTDIERSLEEANVRLYVEQARSQLEFGRHLVEQEDYDRAADALERARSLHERATGQAAAVERADSFAFGRQRELQEALERFSWDLETVAAEPVRQAQEAAVRARESDDTMAAAEYWETAARRYDRILGLDWWEATQEATAEVDDIRAERDAAVDNLVRTRTELASEWWNEAVGRHEGGDHTDAIECCEQAIEHLESAREFAVEFGHESASTLTSRLQQRRDTLAALRAGRLDDGGLEFSSFTRSSPEAASANDDTVSPEPGTSAAVPADDSSVADGGTSEASSPSTSGAANAETRSATGVSTDVTDTRAEPTDAETDTDDASDTQ